MAIDAEHMKLYVAAMSGGDLQQQVEAVRAAAFSQRPYQGGSGL